MKSAVFPELVVGRRDGITRGPWTLERGSSFRGDAYCNLTQRILRVPFDDNESARLIRAHELMHIRVSPVVVESTSLPSDVSLRALECAEEFRVNTLLSRLNFDVSVLRDGSEKSGAEALARREDWSEAVAFLLAVAGTGAEAPYLSGIRRSAPTWLPPLRALRRRIREIEISFDVERMGSTTLNDVGLPHGFSDFTVTVARVAMVASSARVPVGSEELRRFRRSLEPGGRRPPTGRFAELAIDESLLSSQQTVGNVTKRLTPMVTGTVMRYPGRLLTDERRRAFAGHRRIPGGVVVIDQSGSMEVTEEDMKVLLHTAPRTTIIGYSHRPGSYGGSANAWILARGGVVAAHCPTGQIGNGVDGPALEWAIRQRQASGPIVWVTDGQVTDSNDHPDEGLTKWCAQLVLRHQIRMVATLLEIPQALRAGSALVERAWNTHGRVGREIQRMRETSFY